MTCRGICTRIKATRHPSEGWYTHNSRCSSCDIFINFVGTHCPCCGFRLRNKRRNKKKYRQQVT